MQSEFKTTARTLAAIAATLTCAVSAAVALGATGAVTTVAGTGVAGSGGDGGPATLAMVNEPRGVAITDAGELLIADTNNNRIRKILADGRMVTVAGTGQPGFSGNGGPAATARLNEPKGVAAEPGGGFLIADTGNNRVRRVAADGLISTVAGNGYPGGNGDGGPARGASLDRPSGVAGSRAGTLIADTGNDRVRRVGADGRIATVAGNGHDTDDEGSAGDGAVATSVHLDDPRGVAPTPDGGFLIADTDHNRVRKVGPLGRISTVAGTGASGSSGDGGPATAARLDSPTGVAVTASGFLIADRDNDRVRYVAADGRIATLAGTSANAVPLPGFGASVALDRPFSVALGLDGDVSVADTQNHRIRLVDADLGGPPGPGSSPFDPLGDTLPPPAPPIAGKRVNIAPVRGRVHVRVPGHATVELRRAASVPVGSLVLAARGSVRLTSAANLRGKTQAAVFSTGTFAIHQRRARRPVTKLSLRGSLGSCAKRGGRATASASSSRGTVRRRLWGRGKGHFQTRGRNGAATVRGTTWLTADTCAGTLVKVKHGVVSVRDYARHRSVLVAHGEKYLAKKRSRPAKRRAG